MIVKCVADKKVGNFIATRTSDAHPRAEAIPKPSKVPTHVPTLKEKQGGGQPLGSGDESGDILDNETEGKDGASEPPKVKVQKPVAAAPAMGKKPALGERQFNALLTTLDAYVKQGSTGDIVEMVSGVFKIDIFLLSINDKNMVVYDGEELFGVEAKQAAQFNETKRVIFEGSFPGAAGYDFSKLAEDQRRVIAMGPFPHVEGITKEEIESVILNRCLGGVSFANECLPGLVIGGYATVHGVIPSVLRENPPKRVGALPESVVDEADKIARESDSYQIYESIVMLADPNDEKTLEKRAKVKKRIDLIKALETDLMSRRIKYRPLEGNGAFPFVVTTNGDPRLKNKYHFVKANGEPSNLSRCQVKVGGTHIDREVLFGNKKQTLLSKKYKEGFQLDLYRAWDAWRNKNQSVLVHCAEGIERSNAFIICMQALERCLQGEDMTDELKQELIQFQRTVRFGAQTYDDAATRGDSREVMLNILWEHTRELAHIIKVGQGKAPAMVWEISSLAEDYMKVEEATFPGARDFDFSTLKGYHAHKIKEPHSAVFRDQPSKVQKELDEMIQLSYKAFGVECAPGLVIGGLSMIHGVIPCDARENVGLKRLGRLTAEAVSAAEQNAQKQDIYPFISLMFSNQTDPESCSTEEGKKQAIEINPHLISVHKDMMDRRYVYRAVEGNGVFPLVVTANGESDKKQNYYLTDQAGNPSSVAKCYPKTAEGHIDRQVYFGDKREILTSFLYKFRFKQDLFKAWDAWRNKREAVLVHCSEGLERSNAFIICMQGLERCLQGEAMTEELKRELVEFQRSVRFGAQTYSDKGQLQSRQEMLDIIWEHTKELALEIKTQHPDLNTEAQAAD